MKHLFVFIAITALTCGCRGVKQSCPVTDPYSLPTIATLPQDYLTCIGILGEAPPPKQPHGGRTDQGPALSTYGPIPARAFFPCRSRGKDQDRYLDGRSSRAINKLVFEELLERKKGVGTKVVKKLFSSRSNNWLSFTQEMAARGTPVKNFELHISRETLNEGLVSFFGIDPDQKILKLERVRGRVEGPFVYFVSYFHPRIGLTGDEDFKRPLYDILETDHHTVADLSKEEISAMVADKFLANKLDTQVGAAILFRKRYVFDQADRPLEFSLGYYKADSFVYTVESRRQAARPLS